MRDFGQDYLWIKVVPEQLYVKYTIHHTRNQWSIPMLRNFVRDGSPEFVQSRSYPLWNAGDNICPQLTIMIKLFKNL